MPLVLILVSCVCQVNLLIFLVHSSTLLSESRYAFFADLFHVFSCSLTPKCGSARLSLYCLLWIVGYFVENCTYTCAYAQPSEYEILDMVLIHVGFLRTGCYLYLPAGRFGTGVVAYFTFLRGMLFLNFLLTVLAMCFIVGPQISISGNTFGSAICRFGPVTVAFRLPDLESLLLLC